MNVHVLQHAPFEDLGSMAPWLLSRDARITYTRLFEPAAVLPALDDIDFVIALGGPMSVNDEAALPWLVAEKRFVADAIAHGKAVLGICLGAQLIANALGARVYPGPEKEIGWFPISAGLPVEQAYRFPVSARVFHWHGETFDLPAGAVHLASSAGCRNQAFQVGAKVIGLQFHLEMTQEIVAGLLTHCGDELVAGRFVQTEEALRAAPAENYAGIGGMIEDVLAYLEGEMDR